LKDSRYAQTVILFDLVENNFFYFMTYGRVQSIVTVHFWQAEIAEITERNGAT
jgi:hypothetical protein